MFTLGHKLINQLIFNELERLSDLMEDGQTDPLTPNPETEFNAIKNERPDVYAKWAQYANERALDV